MPVRDPFGARFSREILSAEFDIGLETAGMHLAPLITEIRMGDGEGTEQKHIITGNESEPREMYGDNEYFDEIGDYAFSIKPKTYAGGMKAHDHDLADARIPVVQEKARVLGAKAGYFIEKTLVADVIQSATAVDGFDGQPLFSASHNWGTSDLDPGDPASTYNTNQSNIYAAGRSSDYSSTTQVLDDFYGAIAQMNGYVDDKGTKLNQGEGTYYVLANNQSASLMRYLRLAFVEATRPGDDTNRDGFDFGVNLIFSPHLTASAGSTDQDWFIFRIPAGQKAPLVLQRRQDLQSEAWRDPQTMINYWQYTLRFGVSWTSWWNAIQVNNS